MGYLHDKYIESRQALVEGVDVKTQEDHELYDYAKTIVRNDSFVFKYIEESQKPPLTPRGLDDLRAREKRKASLTNQLKSC